jgi:hypothetical protein
VREKRKISKELVRSEERQRDGYIEADCAKEEK